MHLSRRSTIVLSTVVALTAAPAVAFAHGSGAKHRGGPGQHGGPQAGAGPTSIPLPNGFRPEGIASGPGGLLYAGSIPTGAIYRADPRTGKGAVFVAGREGRAATGIKVAGGLIVVSGATTGHAFVYDARTGADVADVTLTTGNSFINDVAIANGAAYFTDSRQRQIYKLDLGLHGGGAAGHHGGGHMRHGPGHLSAGAKSTAAERLRKGGHGADDAKPVAGVATTATTIPITGELVYDADPATNEANGIVALPGGKAAIVVNSRTGELFKIDTATGASVKVPVVGGDLANGDGLLLKGRTLYVVKNRLNQIAVVSLDGAATAGTITRTITSPLFRVPTTITLQHGSLFAVNARFDITPTPDSDFDIVKVAAK